MIRPWIRRLRAGVRLTIRIVADLPRVLQILGREVRRKGPVVASQYAFDHMVRLSTGVPPLAFSRITPHIHLGGQYTAPGWRKLQRRGVTAVVNMRDEFDDAVANIAPDQYLYLPTVDDTPPTIAQLCQGVRFMQREIANGGQVYVHCMLGVGRSVTMVAAYLVATGMTPPAAWKAIRRRRPFIQPTTGQEARLVEFAMQGLNFDVCCDAEELDEEFEFAGMTEDAAEEEITLSPVRVDRREQV